jgi:hypothetical protein
MPNFEGAYGGNENNLPIHFYPRESNLPMIRRIALAVALLALGGCAQPPHSLTGTWHLMEMPGDTWTFETNGHFIARSGKHTYIDGTYGLDIPHNIAVIAAPNQPDLNNLTITWLQDGFCLTTSGKAYYTLHS